jgi:nucleotide-binding universal stress UspA family protein
MKMDPLPPANDVPPAPDEALPPEPDSTLDDAPHPLQRILVALDASAHSHAALAAAVALAARLQSEIVGIFVEDINLLRLADLPFVGEIRFGQVGARRVQGEELRRGLRARAAVLRRELEELTEEYKVRASFRVVQGTVAGELLTAAREADLLALGRVGHSVAHRARLGSTARAAIARAASGVLLVHPEATGGPVLVLYDGSPAGARALALAAHVGGEAGDLRVLVWGPDEETAFDRRQLAARLLATDDAPVQFQHLAGGEAARIVAWVNKQHGRLLIMPVGAGEWPAGTLEALLDEAEPHLLLLR